MLKKINIKPSVELFSLKELLVIVNLIFEFA